MEMKSNQNRWQCLFYMIVSLANGNFSYQIRRTSSNDELEALVALSNMLAEELKETFSHHGFIDPRRSYRYIAKMIFILDEKLQIVYFNSEVPGLLNFKEKDLKLWVFFFMGLGKRKITRLSKLILFNYSS